MGVIDGQEAKWIVNSSWCQLLHCHVCAYILVIHRHDVSEETWTDVLILSSDDHNRGHVVKG